MAEAYIVEAVRSPVGRKKGGLAALHPADLGAHALAALIARTGIDPAAVDDVVMGCVDTIGPQAGDIARTAWLVAGLPDHVPGVTVDRQCGSSQQAIHFAAQGVMSGTQDLVVAAGVQAMNAIPISAAMLAGAPLGFPDPFATSPGWQARYGAAEVSQFRAAQMIADRWGLAREAMEGFALESHARAIAATDGGHFAAEIAPLAGLATDETPRRDTSPARMAALPPLRPGGTIHAGIAAQNADAAAALLIASGRGLKTHGLTPRARIHHLAVRGDDPVWMLTAPIAATRHALARAGLAVADIDLWECNEAFAPVVMAWMKDLDIPRDRVNVNGGAIALGHPLGATGARIMTTLLHELARRGGRYGLQTMCEGGGQANVTIVERL
ncbi:MAG: acetyl-CoA C-acetyltransferase [Rhodobacteraceae bacterium]|nr:acetyl-CoA C-acetyltransferase [Paracoccaceae bacterium]